MTAPNYDSGAGDWRFDEDVRPVRYQVIPGGSPITTAMANQVGPTVKELAFLRGAGIDATTSVWEVWAATIPGISPRVGHTITDSDTQVWTVQSAERISVGDITIRWRCLTIAQRTS